MKKGTKEEGADSSKKDSKSRKVQTTECSKDTKALSNILDKKTTRSKTLEKMIATEGSVEKVTGSEGPSASIMEFDDLTSQDLQDSLIRARENPVEPFKFLCGILEDVSEKHISIESTKATNIDLQLAALTRRIELNRNLLDMTNRRVKEINYLTEKNKILATRDLDYDEECFLKLKEAGDPGTTKSLPETVHPGIDELRRTMNQTREMLRHVKKISNGQMSIEDLPQDLINHISPNKETSEEFKFEVKKNKDKIENQSILNEAGNIGIVRESSASFVGEVPENLD